MQTNFTLSMNTHTHTHTHTYTCLGLGADGGTDWHSTGADAADAAD